MDTAGKSCCSVDGSCSFRPKDAVDNEKDETQSVKEGCCSSGKCSKSKQAVSNDHDHSHRHNTHIPEHYHSTDDAEDEEIVDCCASKTSSAKLDVSHEHDHSHRHNSATLDVAHESSHEPKVHTDEFVCKVNDRSHQEDEIACCEKPAPHSHGKPDCVAILREDGDVDVYDVFGQVKTFCVDPSNAISDKFRLCFSTHGHHDIDGFLTPCFDENGAHGYPEEDCFCGRVEPHMHAHVHSKSNCVGDLKSKFQLATVTLFPKNNLDLRQASTSNNHYCIDQPSVSMPASASLPNTCNSIDVVRSLSKAGIDEVNYNASKQNILQVKHENHIDNLVHNEKTGKITLEHDCDGCGNADIHGALEFVSRRVFSPAMDDEHKLLMNFYAVPKSPLKLLDVFAGFFAMEKDKEHMLRAAFEISKPCVNKKCFNKRCCASRVAPSKTNKVEPCHNEVRSTIHVTGICCASEIPMINSILQSLDGVSELSVITTTKLVHVSHNPKIVTALELTSALNKEKFGATLKKDGGALVGHAKSGRSSFVVPGICCAAEIPAIDSILNPIKGVTEVKVNVPNKTLYIEHELELISATAIKDVLDKEGFKSIIEHDAGEQARSQTFMSNYVESTFVITSLFEQSQIQQVKTLVREQYSKDHVSHCEVHFLSKTIKIDHNPQLLSSEAIAKYLWDLGFEVSVISDGFAEGIWTTGDEERIDEEHIKLHWNIILSGIFWIVSMLHFIGGSWDYVKYVGILSVLLGIPKIASKAYMTMKRKQFDTNCMMLYAAIGALALEEYSEAAAVTFLFSISDWLETLSTARARNALSAIVKLRPERAKVKDPITEKFVYAPASSVTVGSIVSVRTGDKIPCDGIVLEGSSVVDESSLTGESRPVPKVRGLTVSGGTINAGMAPLLIEATSTVDNSAVARLIRLVEDAQANRSPTEKLIDAFAKRYTPLIVILALSMCTFPWIAGHDVGQKWTKIGLVTIVIACPCALIISTPVTYVAGLASAAQRGIVVKGGAHLESLGRVKQIAFDKTGTLTQGNFNLLSLRTWGVKSRSEALQYIYCLEKDASHPLAAALVAAAKAEGTTIPKELKLSNHQNLEGEGVTGTINGDTVYIGNFRLFERLAYTKDISEDELSIAKSWLDDGATVGFLGITGIGVIASYCVADSLRPEAKDVLASFARLNIDVSMLTGDNTKAATSIGRELGLSPRQVKSQLLPHEKLELVNLMMEQSRDDILKSPCWKMKRPGLVLMCGDGVNDAPALATADVGVAMGAGAALAMETADVTLLDSNLLKLLKVVKLGKRVTRTIIENVVFSFVAKAVVMGFAFAGYSSLWAAIGSDVGAMLIVTANGMKLLPSKKSIRSKSGFDSFSVKGNSLLPKAMHSPEEVDKTITKKNVETQKYEC